MIPYLLLTYNVYSHRSNVRPTLCSGGHRGFDNLDPDMRTIFMARGPAFKQGLIIKPFTNIEIYNLMTSTLQIVTNIYHFGNIYDYYLTKTIKL